MKEQAAMVAWQDGCRTAKKRKVCYEWKPEVANCTCPLQHRLMRKQLKACLIILATSSCSDHQTPSVCVPVLPGWATPETGKPVHLISNIVTLNGHNVRWNGVAIDERTLTKYLRETAAMDPVPFLIFDSGVSPDCAYARHVQNILDREYPCRDGACWQGSKSALDEAPFKTAQGNAIP